MRCFLMDRLRRILTTSFGMFIYSFGFYLQVMANVGLSPWQSLNDGLSLHLPMTLGQASIVVSLTVVAIDLLCREPIGLGTILDAFLVGWFVDFFLWLAPLPEQNHFLPGIAFLLTGILFMSVGQYFQMKAALSCGPRDALMVALGKRIPKAPIGAISIALSLTVLTIGWLLGGRVGLGTVISMFGTGIIMDQVFRLLRFEPRSVTHESLPRTLLAFHQACAAAKH